jgi:hypothetical protein
MKLGCTISLKAAVLPGHQLTGPSEEEEEEELLRQKPIVVPRSLHHISWMEYL